MRNLFSSSLRGFSAAHCLPIAFLASVIACGGSPDGSSTSAVSVSILGGVDSAGVFSASTAKSLKDNYGVAWTGVYIGGPCDGGSGWNKSAVESIASATGWQFMPIYVGQNSSEVCGSHNMTQSQGEADGHDAAGNMASFGWDANKKIPVELDLESETYGGDESGSLDYVRGWVSSVHADGYLAYVYSSPDAVNAIAAAGGLGVDGVTVAAWLWNDGEGHFENTTPNGDIGIGSHFSNHNRAWQYCGDISASGIHVDCNVSDLLLAPAPGGSNGSGGGTPPPPASAPDACSQGSGFCTDTLQCDSGHWIVRQDDPAACTKVVNEAISCNVGAGYCTDTLQCDGGHWIPRQDDPTACTSGPGAQ
jgi:hypothetical protein